MAHLLKQNKGSHAFISQIEEIEQKRINIISQAEEDNRKREKKLVKDLEKSNEDRIETCRLEAKDQLKTQQQEVKEQHQKNIKACKVRMQKEKEQSIQKLDDIITQAQVFFLGRISKENTDLSQD